MFKKSYHSGCLLAVIGPSESLKTETVAVNIKTMMTVIGWIERGPQHEYERTNVNLK